MPMPTPMLGQCRCQCRCHSGTAARPLLACMSSHCGCALPNPLGVAETPLLRPWQTFFGTRAFALDVPFLRYCPIFNTPIKRLYCTCITNSRVPKNHAYCPPNESQEIRLKWLTHCTRGSGAKDNSCTGKNGIRGS